MVFYKRRRERYIRSRFGGGDLDFGHVNFEISQPLTSKLWRNSNIFCCDSACNSSSHIKTHLTRIRFSWGSGWMNKKFRVAFVHTAVGRSSSRVCAVQDSARAQRLLSASPLSRACCSGRSRWDGDIGGDWIHIPSSSCAPSTSPGLGFCFQFQQFLLFIVFSPLLL